MAENYTIKMYQPFKVWPRALLTSTQNAASRLGCFFSPAPHCVIGVICFRNGLKFLANEDVVASADNRTPLTQTSMFVTMLSYLLFSNVRNFRLLLYCSQNTVYLYFREQELQNALTGPWGEMCLKIEGNACTHCRIYCIYYARRTARVRRRTELYVISLSLPLPPSIHPSLPRVLGTFGVSVVLIANAYCMCRCASSLFFVTQGWLYHIGS